METDVAAFARRLRQDGLDAASAEADKILEEARAKAAAILEQAQATAALAGQDARAEIERQRRRMASEICLLARDTVLKVREQIEHAAALLLRGPIDRALASEEVVRAAILELLRVGAPGQGWEIRVGPKIGKDLVQALLAELAKGPDAAATLLGELRTSGLEFRTGEGEVLELSEESVAEQFRRLMSPELGRLLDAPRS